MDNYLAILDKNTEYVHKLSSYMEKQSAIPFKVLPFDDVKKLKAFCLGGNVEVLFAGEEFLKDDLAEVAKMTICLTDGKNENLNASDAGVPCISRYQSAPAISRKIMEIVAMSPGEIKAKPVSVSAEKTKVISFFAPGPKNLQTTTALKLCRMIADGSRVLYIGFEPFAGFAARTGRMMENNVTDLIYFIDKSPEKFRLKLSGMVRNEAGVDVIAPPVDYADFKSVTVDEWEDMIKMISLTGVYDLIILDLNESMQGLYEILGISDRIVTVAAKDKLFPDRYREFKDNIPDDHKRRIEDGSVYIELPPGRDHEKLLSGKIAEIVG